MKFVLRWFEWALRLLCRGFVDWVMRRVPSSDKLSSLVFVYLFLQLLALLWALLFNVCSHLALLAGQVIAKRDPSLFTESGLIRGFATFYLAYATLRVFVALGRGVHELTW